MDPKTRKEKCRLISNWIFTILIAPLYSVSLFGISTSFHQFITNPTEEELGNSTDSNVQPGLGQSEFFYSVLLSGTNVGAIIGGIASGFLVKSVPYWYLWAVGLFVHIIGFIIHCVARIAWLILISRLCAGYLIGAMITLGFSYFTMTSEQYAQLNNSGEKSKETEGYRLRNYLFSINSIRYSVGLIVGSGATAIFAQFESVDQFRAIGWFNVAYGVVGMILLVVMFHGEIKCKKMDQCFQICPNRKGSSRKNRVGVLAFFIIISLLMLSLFERMRFSFVQTLFNPIASDSFGIDERGAAYFFLFLSVPQLGGSIVLIILQCVKLSSQGITLLAVALTMAGYVVVTDWQTIPYDQCTEYSPFHHPGLAHDLNLTYGGDFEKYGTGDHDHYGMRNWTIQEEAFVQQGNPTGKFTLPELTNLKLLSELNIDSSTGSKLSFEADLINFSCKTAIANTCNCKLNPTTCLRLTIEHDRKVTLGSLTDPQEIFHCTTSDNTFHLELCVFLSKSAPSMQLTRIQSIMEETASEPEADIESIALLPKNLYIVAKNNCIEANVTGHECHWIPSSEILNKECEDCPPICRSERQTLTFAQFLIGNSLLVFASALQIVPVVSLLMNQSPEQIQGIVIGCMTAMNAISRTVAPMLLDAVYEGMQKRNFLLTMIMAFIHIPFIIEIIALYPKLGPKTKKEKVEYSKLDTVDKGDE